MLPALFLFKFQKAISLSMGHSVNKYALALGLDMQIYVHVIRKTEEAYKGHNMPICHYTDLWVEVSIMAKGRIMA